MIVDISGDMKALHGMGREREDFMGSLLQETPRSSIIE